MTLNRVLTIVLFLASLLLFYLLVRSVNTTIEERESIATKENAVIERLKLIRESQTVFQSVYGRYTANWDSLADFIERGRVAIVEKKETIVSKGYGQEDVIISYDTLGFVPAKDRIFKKTFTVNAADNGTFVGFKVQAGEQVVRNQRAYSIRANNKVSDPPLIEDGTVESLEALKPGDVLRKGQAVMTLSKFIFNPNINVREIGFIPGRENQRFDIFVGKVDKNGLLVDVIEVRDPKPDDPQRKADNKARNRQPLHFGSKVDVSTSGNWE